MSSLVKNPAIAGAQLLVPKAAIQRPYVWPFAFIYPFFFQIYSQHYDTYIGGKEWTFVYLMAIISLNILLWLMPYWNIGVNIAFNYDKVQTLEQAQYINITPAPNSGVGDICKINREVFHDGELQISFLYQKRRHLFHPELNKFAPPEFEFDNSPKLKFYQTAKGISGNLEKNLRVYGGNKFDIPIPTFLELFKEHAVAPFFVFQLFSMALWLLDEQWYYSLFSLFMLVTFEMTTVFQRRTTMTEFQSMGIKPYPIWVHRDLKWVELQTEELLPNDLVSIVRTNDGSAVPCDLLLVDGSAIVNEAMLSGESTPLLKESVKLRPSEERLDPEGFDKNLLLHGGTTILQVSGPNSDLLQVPPPPDGGALAVVTKTGFETLQGSLVRMMIFLSERVSAGNKEALFFILFLLIFAIVASWYVWVEGTRMGRIQSKLILDCIMVITSVVPPELPMELTMAVNSSLASLLKYYIYCTEPFRIPLAGRIDVCCFDKTGTLTAEDLVFEGLAGLDELKGIHHLFATDEAPDTTLYVLGSCHALVLLEDGEVVGDPMEQATLKAARWEVAPKDVVERKKANGKPEKVKILRRFQFSSALKRSSLISQVSTVQGKNLVSVKGAPETIKERLVDAPASYDDVYKSFTRNGSRVLALAYKYIDTSTSVTKVTRESVELKLNFAGFIVFHCPLKDDAIETIKMLNESSHRSIMITGDNPLTACHVAKEVKITTKEVLILDAPEDHHSVSEDLVWRNVDETKVIPFKSTDNIDTSLFESNDICVTGYALKYIDTHPQLLDLLKHSWIYARVLPSQKEFILNTLKEAGYNTLMCGDGTNDVGALKQAHIGVALLNGTEAGMKKIADARKIETNKAVYDKQVQIFANWGRPPPPCPLIIAHLYPPGPSNPKYLEAMEKKGVEITEEMKEAVEIANKEGFVPKVQPNHKGGSKPNFEDLSDSLMGAFNSAEMEDEAPTIKLGDASVAAPFTSKLASVSAVTNIIRQGRCALVSTIQMYKILALNCLISAYSLSVLYLAGMKFGDGQATVSGILLSVCFLSISRGKPIEKLLKERPQDKIFCTYIMGSILSQFAIHLITLVYITHEIYLLEPQEPTVNLEKTFSPSLLNTGMFLVQLAQQVSTFAVNYQGLPFRESIKDNKGMYYGLLGVAALTFSGSTEFFPELNEAMKFVPMSTDFKVKLTGVILFDLIGAWVCELFFKYFFMNSAPADIAIRED